MHRRKTSNSLHWHVYIHISMNWRRCVYQYTAKRNVNGCLQKVSLSTAGSLR